MCQGHLPVQKFRHNMGHCIQMSENFSQIVSREASDYSRGLAVVPSFLPKSFRIMPGLLVNACPFLQTDVGIKFETTTTMIRFQSWAKFCTDRFAFHGLCRKETNTVSHSGLLVTWTLALGNNPGSRLPACMSGFAFNFSASAVSADRATPWRRTRRPQPCPALIKCHLETQFCCAVCTVSHRRLDASRGCSWQKTLPSTICFYSIIVERSSTQCASWTLFVRTSGDILA